MGQKMYSVFVLTTLCLSTCLAITSTKRQGVGGSFPVPARDLLPPPALSASFPTLRPNNGKHGQQSPQVNLIPPFRPGGDKSPLPHPPSSSNTRTESPLLPPIEIPPAKPLTDAEIAALSFTDSSFVPTTGQGVGGSDHESRKNVQITTVEENQVQLPIRQVQPAQPVQPVHQVAPVQPLQQVHPVHPTQSVQSHTANIGANTVKSTKSINSTRSITKIPGSHVKFPDSPPPAGLGQLCPICECTPEVDYICGSNGVIYLNSCSFDCATFCEAGLTKVSLDRCSLKNHL